MNTYEISTRMNEHAVTRARQILKSRYGGEEIGRWPMTLRLAEMGDLRAWCRINELLMDDAKPLWGKDETPPRWWLEAFNKPTSYGKSGGDA